LVDAVQQATPHLHQSLAEHVDAAAGLAGEVGDRLLGAVAELQQPPLLGRQALQAAAQGGAAFVGPGLGAVAGLGDLFKQVAGQERQVLAPRPAEPQGLEVRELPGPRHERRRRVVAVELPPQRQGGLLHDLLRVGQPRHQRDDVAEQVPLMLHQQPDERLMLRIGHHPSPAPAARTARSRLLSAPARRT
jgi:hypothetical protein